MSDNQNDKHATYTKIAWVIYATLAIMVSVCMVLFVAIDNEERVFYGVGVLAVSYFVLRPTDKFMNKMIFKYTGVSEPTKPE